MTGEWKRLHNGELKGLCSRELFADIINEIIQVTDTHKHLHLGSRVHAVCMVLSFSFFFFLLFMER